MYTSSRPGSVTVSGAHSFRMCDSFDDMELPETLLRGIYSYGFEMPSVIQKRAIQPVMEGRDTICQAQSGTGKTASFMIGVLARLDLRQVSCQALVLCPTQELSLQTQMLLGDLGKYMDMRCHACVDECIGEVDMAAVRAGQHIIVGTPGPVLELVENKALNFDSLRTLIIDEAHELLSAAFVNRVYSIYLKVIRLEVQVDMLGSKVPLDVLDLIRQFAHNRVQVCLLSDSLPKDIFDLATRIVRNPVGILAKPANLTLEGIQQFYVQVNREEHKLDTLYDIYEDLCIQKSIIYCKTPKIAEALAREMKKRDFTVSVIHAGLSGTERSSVVGKFKSGSSRVLISTELLARGIHVEQVSLVINYNLPTRPENYLLQIGHSRRFGCTGVAISFITNEDMKTLRRIEMHYITQIENFCQRYDV